MDARLWTATRFLLVGGSGMMVNNLVLIILYQVVGLPFILASTIAVELAIINNFVWNDRWTFRRTRISLVRFARFNLVALVSLLITTSTAALLLWGMSLHFVVANLVGIAFATACNLGLNFGWTWRGAWRREPLRS